MCCPEEPPPLVKFVLYSTKTRFFLLGRTKDRAQWRVLKFARDASNARELDVLEDPVVYSEREVAALLSSVHDGNLPHGGLTFVAQVRVGAVSRRRRRARSRISAAVTATHGPMSRGARRRTPLSGALRCWRAAICCS